ncbi:MAG TPA: transcriptional regulator NrdR [Candidatus Kapabacteria bacterium]|nr:transcriptional regulator NrdR [Candidatus Kapabacteria bacterium]
MKILSQEDFPFLLEHGTIREIVFLMYCPICRSKETRVIDSRLTQDAMAIRRRRECEKCHYRFSTLEEMELLDIIVVKNDGRRELYSRAKLERGILQSLVKRPYTQEKFSRLIHAVERDIQKRPARGSVSGKQREVTSREVGEIVMKHLEKFDKVAYIRFASIYRAFEDVDRFQTVIRSLQGSRLEKKSKKRKK